jgi:hypothetical protein
MAGLPERPLLGDLRSAVPSCVTFVVDCLLTGKGKGLMVPMTHRRSYAVVLCAFALVAVSGCGDDSDVATSKPTTSATSMPSSAGQAYSSTAFVPPLSVAVDPVLKSPPTTDSRSLLSWDAVASQDNKVRFLVPVEIYRPGGDTPGKLPQNYLTYLQGLAKDGVEVSDVVKTTVDGHPATLMNLSSTFAANRPDGFFDGVLGCPTRGADQSEGCYGPQPDLTLHLGVIDVGGTTLLAWARTSKDNPDPPFVAAFERMLASVRFR